MGKANDIRKARTLKLLTGRGVPRPPLTVARPRPQAPALYLGDTPGADARPVCPAARFSGERPPEKPPLFPGDPGAVERRERVRREVGPGGDRRLLVPENCPWLADMAPPEVPGGWVMEGRGADGWAFVGPPPDLLIVILSGDAYGDGRRWAHLSCSGAQRCPTWGELAAVKELFLGTGSVGLMVLPPRAEWVNIHPFCLHVWVCADERVTPDFRGGTESI